MTPETKMKLLAATNAAEEAIEELHALHTHYLPACGGGCPYATIAANLQTATDGLYGLLQETRAPSAGAKEKA